MKTTLFLLLFLPFLSFGQSQLDVFGSADLTGANYGWDSFSGSVRNSKKVRFNTHFGVNYYQKIKEDLWFKVGLGFVSTGFRENIIGLRYGSQHDGQGGFDPNAPAEEFSTKVNHYFLEVPIALRMDFSGKKITPFIEVGLSTMYYLQTVSIWNEIGSESRNVDRYRAEETKHIQLAPVLSIGANYKLNEKWSIYIQPNFRYHLTKMAEEPSIGVHQWGIGVGVGARMNLK